MLLIALLAVGLTVLLYNPGLIKGPLERYLSDVAGYPISLHGELEIDVGRLTELTANNIRISGPDWASHEMLAEAGHLYLVLNTASVFEDTIVIESLAVDELHLNLETNADGKGNWVTANAAPAAQGDDSEDDVKPFIVFGNIELSNVTLRYLRGSTGAEHVLQVASLSHHQRSDGMMNTTLDGALNGRLIEYTGTLGPYVNLLNGRDVSYTAEGQFGELKISSDGLIDDLLKPRKPRFNLDMQGPNIDEITAMLGVDDLGGGGFTLRAKGKEADGMYKADINGHIGDVSLNASAQASDLVQLDTLDLNLAINGPSLGAFTRAFGIEHWPDKPFSLEGDVDRVGGTLNIDNLTLNIGGTQLLLDALLTNFPSLEASRIKLLVTGDDVAQFRDLLGIPGIATGPFEIKGKLDVSLDKVELVHIDVKTSLGHATVSGTLGPAPEYTGSKLQVHLDGDNANSLMSAFNIDTLPEQPFNLNTRVELVENGLRVERGVLVTIEDDRLELGGFIAFKPGIKGTDLEVKVSGRNLAEMLHRLVGDFEVPDQPYSLGGRVQVQEEGIRLENVDAEFEGIKLMADGLIRLEDRLLGSGLDFQLNGENLSSLSNFPAIGDSLDIFVPGQSYQATGRFTVENNGWQLQDVNARIGKTDLDLDALISNQPKWLGSMISFSVKGPGLSQLLAKRGESGLPSGAFVSSGKVMLSDKTLNIQGFTFENAMAHGKIDLELGWPVSAAIDVGFDMNIWGDDIRQLLPQTGSFKAANAAYKLEAAGRKQGDLVSLKQLNGNIGDLRISMKGKVADHPTDANVEISFSATSKNISTLGHLNGEPLPSQALDLSANLKGNARQFVIRNLNGSLGQSRLQGSLDVSLKGPRPIIKLTASSNYIDIRPFQVTDDSTDKSEGESESETDTASERLIPATPLPLEALAAADIAVKLNVAEIRHAEDSMRNLVFEAETTAGGLEVKQWSIDAPRGKLKTGFSIIPTSANRADVKIELEAEKLVLNLSGLPREKLSQVAAYDVDLKVSGQGSNLQEVAGSLNGSFYMGSTGGMMDGVDLSLLDTFLLDEIFSMLMPKSDAAKDTQLSCAAAIFEIKNGMLETNPALAFTTDRITVITKGTLDLNTEKMHFNFNATPNQALQISATELFNPYILISGTLAKPVVGVDPAKALLHGGVAVGTAGISILAKGLIDRVGNTVSLCEQMLSQEYREKQEKKKKRKG